MRPSGLFVKSMSPSSRAASSGGLADTAKTSASVMFCNVRLSNAGDIRARISSHVTLPRSGTVFSGMFPSNDAMPKSKSPMSLTGMSFTGDPRSRISLTGTSFTGDACRAERWLSRNASGGTLSTGTRLPPASTRPSGSVVVMTTESTVPSEVSLSVAAWMETLSQKKSPPHEPAVSTHSSVSVWPGDPAR